MRFPVRCIEITSVKKAHSEMERIGVDPVGIRIMTPKQFHRNLKVERLTPAQANIIKQEMLSAGGEAAIARGAASCSVAASDAVLSGTLRQYRVLIEKLAIQAMGLKEVAVSVKEALDNIERKTFTLKGRTRSWTAGGRTLVMGVLNVTPDSFSDGAMFSDPAAAVERGLEMIEEGADWVDVGGESTRPGSAPVAVDEEIRRVVPVIEALASKGVPVSVDTMKSAVAKSALEAGAEIVNDVSALSFDKEMAGVCAAHKCPVILMHMRGTPKTMQEDTAYADLMGEVYGYLLERLEYARSSGIDIENTVVDPGIGFGKSTEGNIEIITHLAELRSLGRPVLLGASRKAFIGKTLGALVQERLHGTMAVLAVAVANGAGIVRVHDVKEAVQTVRMADALKQCRE